MKTNTQRLTIVTIFLMMLMSAVIESMRGILMPSFKEIIGMNNSLVATMLTVGSLGYVSATFIANPISRRFGNKVLMMTAVSCLILSALTLAYTTNYPLYLTGMVLMNIGLGLNSVGANVLIPMLIVSFQVFIMNSLHFMYGLGAMIGQRLSGYLITHGVGTKELYFGVLAVYGLLLLFILLSHFPDESVETKHNLPLRHFVKDRLFLLYIFGLSGYVFGEQGLAVWLADYLKEIFLIDENQSSTYLSAFFILLGLGRLAGGLVVERLGRFRSVLIGLSLGLACVLIGLLSGSRWLGLISLGGLFYSIVFPTMVVNASLSFPRNRAQAISLVLTGTSALVMVYNQVMGLLSDWIGYHWSIYLIPLATVLAIVFLGRLWYLTEKVN